MNSFGRQVLGLVNAREDESLRDEETNEHDEEMREAGQKKVLHGKTGHTHKRLGPPIPTLIWGNAAKDCIFPYVL